MPSAGSAEACPACGSVKTYPHAGARVRCLGCRLERPAARPSSPELARPAGRVRESFALYDRLAEGRLTQPPAQSRALDLACGAGAFLDLLQEHGFITEGLESGPSADIAERSHRVFRTDPLAADADTLDRGAYHLVSFLDVLQRLPDPVRALAWTRERLSEGGFALIDVPNARAQGFDDPGRGAYVIFDRPSLAGVAARAGLKLTAHWAGPDLVRTLEDGLGRLGPLSAPAFQALRRIAPAAHAADPLLAKLPKSANKGPRLVAILERR